MMRLMDISEETVVTLVVNEQVLIKVPKKKVRYEPKCEETYFYEYNGVVNQDTWNDHPLDKDMFNNFNVFKTEGQANQVADWQRQFNAVAMACSLVNKDTEDEEVFRLYKSSNGCWDSLFWDLGLKHDEPYVSSEEQADQAIKLLESWGV